MPARRTILWMGVSFSVGFLLALLFGFMVWTGLQIRGRLIPHADSQSPRITVLITIDPQRRDELFAELRKFGSEQHFRVVIDSMDAGGDEFQVWMQRADVSLDGVNAFDRTQYELSFYDTDPNRPIPQATLNALVSRLRFFVGSVPGTAFSLK